MTPSSSSGETILARQSTGVQRRLRPPPRSPAHESPEDGREEERLPGSCSSLGRRQFSAQRRPTAGLRGGVSRQVGQSDERRASKGRSCGCERNGGQCGKVSEAHHLKLLNTPSCGRCCCSLLLRKLSQHQCERVRVLIGQQNNTCLQSGKQTEEVWCILVWSSVVCGMTLGIFEVFVFFADCGTRGLCDLQGL